MELFRNKYFLVAIFATTLLCIGSIVYSQYVLAIIPAFALLIYFLIHNSYLYSIVTLVFVSVSIPISYFYADLGADVYMPSEPMLFLCMILIVFNIIYTRRVDLEFLKHPVTIAISIYLFWIFITSITSSMPLVSFKYLLVRLWFIAFFYYFAYELFKRKSSRIHSWVIIYSFFILIVIGYALGRQFYYGIEIKKIAYWAAFPFFKDHTSYGALLAMYIPFLIGYSFSSVMAKKYRPVFMAVLLVYIVAIVFSYTRAAWISLFGAFVLYALIRFRFKLKTLMLMIVGIVIVSGLLFALFFDKLEQNKQESSLDFAQHFQSIANISNDASNMERINRWKCAYRMFLEKPVFGYGPGTYMFSYAPFQMRRDKTIISTNAGDLGNAHSEYLGTLAESGIVGMLSFIFLIFIVSYVAIRAYNRSVSSLHRFWVMGAFIGLATYYSHSLVNNFLDVDKIALPFWSFIAIIVYVDNQSRSEVVTKETPLPIE
ncbi:MAG: O-antigen ligase family protein [Salinivirgaceae bacterium]|nr:O-antigen ligase family protein [Salinivirgaceae bacterium]MDY0278963.1 O-antigen ligase family protein [Salinivirgaceae bacterium]